jgi:hypothetical protein
MALGADRASSALTQQGAPPDGLAYWLISGRDDAEFGRRVSEWVAGGYVP